MAVATMPGRCQDELREYVGVAELIPDTVVDKILTVLDDHHAEIRQWQNLSMGRKSAIDGVYARVQVPTAEVGATLNDIIRAKPAALRNFAFNVRPVGIADTGSFDVDIVAGTALLF